MIRLNTKNYKVFISGESHSKNIFLKIKGVKKGNKFDPFLIEEEIQRRKPKKEYETKRRDMDLSCIISGIRKNKFSKKKLKVKFTNDSLSLKNYEIFEKIPRPGHADFARIKKYGSLLKKGSDIFSGRLTLPIVYAGAVAKMHLENILFESKIVSIGGVRDFNSFEKVKLDALNNGDSIGAVLRVVIKNVPPGLGDLSYYPTDSLLASLLYRIPGVKGVSFGIGFEGEKLSGSLFNDLIIDENGKTLTNNSGGITSGLTNGHDIVVNVFLRPASSIKKTQKTINLETKKMDQLNIKGSHDSFYQERAQVVCESMLAIGIYDLILQNRW